nr:MAG TPA: hypothetical protein [Caudoviricetes sp.]
MERKRFGMQLDEMTNDLKIENGHIAIGETLPQNEFLLLVMNKGELKEDPLVGVGISDMINDNDILGWKRKIRDGLKADGMKVEQISISSDGRIKKLEAKY